MGPALRDRVYVHVALFRAPQRGRNDETAGSRGEGVPKEGRHGGRVVSATKMFESLVTTINIRVSRDTDRVFFPLN